MSTHISQAPKKAIRTIVIGLTLVLFLLGLFLTTKPAAAATTTFQVSASSDDVNEDGSTFTTNATTLWLGNASSKTASYTGLRFTNIAIPPGSTITSAKLSVYSSQSQWISISMSIAGDLSPNSSTFSTTNQPSQRTLTSNKISHSDNVSWAANTWYTLDEMAPVVQEIINESGWQSGNSLSIILTGTGNSWGRKVIQSWDGSSANAPKLQVVFTSGSGATSTSTPTTVPTSTSTTAPTWTNTPTSVLPTATLNSGPTSTPTPTSTSTPTATSLPPTATPTSGPTATSLPPTPTSTPTQTPTATSLPPTATSTSGPTATSLPPTPTSTASPNLLESFETDPSQWKVSRDQSGSGIVTRSTAQASDGSASALLSTASANSLAQVRVSFSDPASQHTWNERPGTYFWQQADVYLPSATLSQLGPNDTLTLAGLWSSAAGAGWFLRVHQNGQLFVQGVRYDTGQPVEFKIYATFPTDRWVHLEIGLHSQNGPGVKRAFAFLLDGQFYGWYHQGQLTTETYDRAAMGILSTTSSQPLSVYVDAWAYATSANFPGGPDLRSSASLQEKDYRTQSGAQWQIDWTTWANNLTLDPTHGLYSPTDRFQSGYNQDRMPDLSSGWAEIELDWPLGTPPSAPSGYFGPMVGFRKEINREENLEIIPIGQGGGNVNLAFEAWAGGGPVIYQQWPLPLASSGSNHLPEPGDVIRARWEQVNPTDVHVSASYFDASANLWYTNILDTTLNLSSVAGVNFDDGYHTASSITADTPYYSIRRYKVGVLSTYPTGSTPTPTPLPATATPLPPTATPTPTILPPTPTPTGLTPTPTPTRTPTPTPPPATATPTPTALPPTPTPTLSAPTSTPTSMAPTMTPTATTTNSILYVQSQLAYSTNYASSQSLTLPSAVTAGHAVVVAVSAYSNSIGSTASVTDSSGNVYVKAVQNPSPASGNHSLSIWYALNISASPNLLVTANAPAGNTEFITIAAQEYSGITSVSALDQTAYSQGSGVSATSGSTSTTTQANELIFGAFLHEQDSPSSPTAATPAAGFTLRKFLYDGTYEPLVTEDETINQVNNYSAGLTWNKTAVWLGAVVTLKGG